VLHDEGVEWIIWFLLWKGELKFSFYSWGCVVWVKSHVSAAMKNNSDDLPLLDLFEIQLTQPLARINIVLVKQVLSKLIDIRKKHKARRTSLLIKTTKIFRRMSVFIPCFLARRRRLSSGLSRVFFESTLEDAWRLSLVCCRSAKGSPAHPDPTNHHLPRVSEESKSFRLTFSASRPRTDVSKKKKKKIIKRVRRKGSSSAENPYLAVC